MEAARTATAADVPRIADLHRGALAAMAEQRGGALFGRREARPEPYADGITALLGDADARVVVGTIDDVVLGYGVASAETLRDGTRHGVIEELYVEAEARAVGLGEAIAGDLVQWLGERGVAGIDAYALPGDRSTKNFFEASGFTARLLVMHHRMTEDERG